MKKLFFCFLLFLFYFLLFSAQVKKESENPSSNEKDSRLDGWTLKISSDTAKFKNVFFQTENLGCVNTGYQPIKRTTDGGNTWGYTVVPNVAATYDSNIYFNGNDLITIAYTSNPPTYYGHFFKSSNLGVNWNLAFTITWPLSSSNTITMYSLNKQIGYATLGNAYPNTHKTNNGGTNWLTIFQTGYLLPNSISFVDTSVIYGVFNNIGIGRSLSGSFTFNILKNGSFSKVCVVDSSNILALSGIKLFRSVNAGANWDSTVFPVKLSSIAFPDQNTGYITGGAGKIFKSTNKGVLWYAQNSPTTDSLVDCSFLNTTTGYIIGTNGVLLKTNDGGGALIPFTISGNVKYQDNNLNVTGGKVKAFRYDNFTGAGNVIVLDSAQIQSDGSYILNNVPLGDVYIGAVPNSSPPSDYVFTYYPSVIYWQDATILHVYGNQTNINISVLRMVAGTSPNHIGGKVNSINYSSPLKDVNLYAKSGYTFIGFNSSNLNGNYLINNLPNGSIKVIADRMGYRADSVTVNLTDKSSLDSVNFYLSKLIVAGINPISNIAPDKYLLYQNYPNPFNPYTKIRYQLVCSNFVTLKIYDILGKEISTLVNENQKAGIYETTFNADNLPSGIYFYRIAAGDFSETRKMVLIK
jgi:photosystem II stability/assembly factor-like uncharacterized protein